MPNKIQASSSYLSALNPLPKIHHISTNPLSAASYPNIQPLAVITPKASLPYRSNTFSSIHAFALPTILPAASIPLILRECHRTLISSSTFQPTHHTLLPSTPPVYFSSTSSLSSEVTVVPAKSRPSVTAGVLHLTILDPAPLPDTLGPRLRAWLDSHLMLNLERRFRCINPGRLFPIWLADAGLRAEGSTIVTARFLACVNNAAHGLDVEASFFEGHGVKQQLKSVVGRMLWKEMWGAFVEGERWWWEDEAIVDECERLGTCWEYVIIEAVKQG